jgi:hypothetical protein
MPYILTIWLGVSSGAEGLRHRGCRLTWYTSTMPKRTIYVRDADLPLWERAERASGANLSAFLTAALRAYLETEEFKEMAIQIQSHGPVVKKVLYVWASHDGPAGSAWGTSFEADGTGPDQAMALVEQLRRDSTVRNIELEERQVFADNWVGRHSVRTWNQTATP